MKRDSIIEWYLNKQYGYGAGRANPCVRLVPCSVCGAKRYQLCRGKLGEMLDTHYKRRMSGKSLKPKVKYKGNDVIMTTKKVMETVSLCHDIVIGEAEIFYLEYVFQLDSKIETMLFNLPWMGMLFMKGVLVADDVIYNNKIDCYMMSPKNPYIINPIEKLVPKYGKMKVLIEYTGHCPVDYRMGEKYTVNMVMWGNSIKE